MVLKSRVFYLMAGGLSGVFKPLNLCISTGTGTFIHSIFRVKERLADTSRALQEADNWTSLDNQVGFGSHREFDRCDFF
jgi:hypothetical protein